MLLKDRRGRLKFRETEGWKKTVTSPAEGWLSLPQESVDYSSQQRRFILFFPVDETAMTTSTLLPQLLQSRPMLFESARAATSVFDLTFPAMMFPPFQIISPSEKSQKSPVHVRHACSFTISVSSLQVV